MLNFRALDELEAEFVDTTRSAFERKMRSSNRWLTGLETGRQRRPRPAGLLMVTTGTYDLAMTGLLVIRVPTRRRLPH